MARPFFGLAVAIGLRWTFALAGAVEIVSGVQFARALRGPAGSSPHAGLAR